MKRISTIFGKSDRPGLRDGDGRIQALIEQYERLQVILRARALDPAMRGVPGAETGLLVPRPRRLGRGRDAVVVREYILDVGMLRELRAITEQLKRECASPPSSARKTKVGIDFEKLNEDQIRQFAALEKEFREAGALPREGDAAV
ncbi:MAG: hypothetical protein KIT09_10265 [Bryobacteraceae bacterium]|nr:hypothetical protein [Bryobacteraceae bacterium]